jgi:kynurenine formamidase
MAALEMIDLSMPIGRHFRWATDVEVTGDIGAGDDFRVTRLRTTCHGFTHVDARAHCVADAPTIERTPLGQVVGPCRVLNLRATAPNTPIDAAQLEAADPGGPDGEILLLSVGWNAQRDYATPLFWTEAPWLTRNAAEWLAARRPSAVAFDFPQDYTIRLLLEGKRPPKADHVTHDVLLRHGVTLIEYLINTARLTRPRTFLCAAPLLIPGADGAPARVFAIEGLPD